MALVLFMGELGYRHVQWEAQNDTYSSYTARIPSTPPLAVFGPKTPKSKGTRYRPVLRLRSSDRLDLGLCRYVLIEVSTPIPGSCCAEPVCRNEHFDLVEGLPRDPDNATPHSLDSKC